jgi:hypothetical protein
MSQAASSEERHSLLARARGTGFYAERLAGADAARWSAIAPTRRADLVRDQLAHLPFGTRRAATAATPVRAGATGSGEDLLVLAWSEEDLALERRAGTRLLTRVGVAPASGVANTLPGALSSPGSLLFGDVVEEHGALDVPLGAIESDAAAKGAWELVDRVQPAVLCLETSTAARLFAAAPAASRPWLHGMLWLRRAGSPASPTEVPAAVGFAGWQRSWLSVAEVSSFAASSCGAGGFHADESVLAEVDADGSLLLTALEGDTAMVRYDSGVKARLLEPCACGGGRAFSLA